MSQEKIRYKATIDGHNYTIIGNENKEHMDLVMELLNHQLEEIKSLNKEINSEQAAILLAINALSDQAKKQEKLLVLEEKYQVANEKAKKVDELEGRVQRIEILEEQAKQILQESGKDCESITHIEAQQIVNQQMKEKIQKHQRELN